ncbi:MAG TPA: gephyrin-like molybdotransferase Glp, partial [Chloroflexota bacterium]|nr:gephyrin-like molybdotransferase Glp [Chloroflexota bacterium]
ARALPVEVGGPVLVYAGVKPGETVRAAAADVRAGEVVLRAGSSIGPAAIGVLASVGKATVMVHRRPRVAILATGDELVDVERRPGPGEIRNSNNYAVAAQVASWGAEAFNLGIARDDRRHLVAKLEQALQFKPDLLVTSAGVSVGDYDLVKEVLDAMGTISMWRVRVRPGKPLAFGRLGEGNVPFLGLPGNPVSAMVTMELFGRPAILKMLGKKRLERPVVMARVLENLENHGGREHYIRGVVSRERDEYVARSTGDQGSNLLTSMAKANALLVVDEKTTLVREGEMVRAMMLEWPDESSR